MYFVYYEDGSCNMGDHQANKRIAELKAKYYDIVRLIEGTEIGCP